MNSFTKRRSGHLRLARTVLALALLFGLAVSSVYSQPPNAYWHEARSWAAADLGLARINGLAFDAASGQFHIWGEQGGLNRPAASSVRVNLAGDVLGVDEANAGPVAALAGSPNAALDAATGDLYTVAADGRAILVSNNDGQTVGVLDVSELDDFEPQVLLIAPSGDPTDEPATSSLYVLDKGAHGESDRIVELYLRAPPATVLQAPAQGPSPAAVLQFRTVRTSLWSPPSPDPAGVDYHPGLQQLVIGDGEVEETGVFQGVNIFRATRAGQLAGTCDVTDFSDEPVGVAVNPTNGSIFISDDNADEVFEVHLGPDKAYCTADDSVTSIDARAYGSQDPEGIAFGQGKLFIADGLGAELYIVSPGPNGIFDGRSPTGDDVLVNHFDTNALGIRDPEGVGFHPQRQTLFFVSRLERESLFEVSLAGKVINVFNIGPLNTVLPSGVGIGPSTQVAGKMSAYIVDRMLDNDTHPNENDGRLYEVTLANLPPLPQSGPIYISHAAATSVALGLPRTGDEDILRYDGQAWSLFFDGSDVGLTTRDLDAFHIVDADSILMSFMEPGAIGSLGVVDDSDIVRFDATSLGNNTAGNFSLYFDGSDVLLTTAAEDVDAIDLLPDGRLVLATVGAFGVNGLSGRADELVAFTPTTLGANTAGTWSLYFDGSDVGIKPTANIDGVDVAANGDIYLTTAANINLAGSVVADEDVFICRPTTLGANTGCNFEPALYFDGSAWGLGADDVDAIQIP
ncbi:hypothetical protein [Promineifilum sp.]|uniref:hypothetical protein n=1 Tax=Promineifilum sp. TaxID=2664178 RepID=UPI0035B464C1